MNKEIFEKRLNNFYKFYSCFNNDTSGPNYHAISVAFLTLLGYDLCSSDVKDYDVKGKYFMVAVGKSKTNKSAIKLVSGRSALSVKFFDTSFVADSDIVIITDGIIFKFYYIDRQNRVLYEKSLNGGMVNNFKDESSFLMSIMRNSGISMDDVKRFMEAHYD